MEYLADTWWVWLAIAITINVLGFVLLIIGTAINNAYIALTGIVIHIVSSILWFMFIIGAIAALIQLTTK